MTWVENYDQTPKASQQTACIPETQKTEEIDLVKAEKRTMTFARRGPLKCIFFLTLSSLLSILTFKNFSRLFNFHFPSILSFGKVHLALPVWISN